MPILFYDALHRKSQLGRFRTLIIVSLIVAVAAILIMPQVDMPAAVVNSAKVQITSLVH